MRTTITLEPDVQALIRTAMMERDISKMKDEVARAEREKASIESYIKVIPEKERELAEMRAENIQLRAREAAVTSPQPAGS